MSKQLTIEDFEKAQKIMNEIMGKAPTILPIIVSPTQFERLKKKYPHIFKERNHGGNTFISSTSRKSGS
jgi:hypothetical protein